LRGGKYSAFEAGTRTPFIVRWPRRVTPGVSDAMVSHTDLLASFAALTEQTLADEAGPDSFNVMPALLGQSKEGRKQLVEVSLTVSLRDGNWKYIEPKEGRAINTNVNIETGLNEEPQLYDLATDPGERKNVAGANASRVEEMRALLEKIRADESSRGGL
jgi:arylsulfatase A-like enzyme